MNARGDVPGPTLIMWFVIGIVILAGMVFAVREAISKTKDIECTGDILDCDDEEEIPVPRAESTGVLSLDFSVNGARVSSSVKLNPNGPNYVKVQGFDGNNCQAVILVDGELYREEETITGWGRCANNLTIEFDELQNSADSKIELDVVVYKPGISNRYHEPSTWLINKKAEVTIS